MTLLKVITDTISISISIAFDLHFTHCSLMNWMNYIKLSSRISVVKIELRMKNLKIKWFLFPLIHYTTPNTSLHIAKQIIWAHFLTFEALAFIVIENSLLRRPVCLAFHLTLHCVLTHTIQGKDPKEKAKREWERDALLHHCVIVCKMLHKFAQSGNWCRWNTMNVTHKRHK